MTASPWAAALLKALRAPRGYPGSATRGVLEDLGGLEVVLAAWVGAIEKGIGPQRGIGQPHLVHQAARLL